MKKLSKWAQDQGISYNTAYRLFKYGEIPNAQQLESGMIVIKEDSAPAPIINNTSECKLSNEMCFLYGYYVAEGSVGGNGYQIQFAGHQKEINVAQILQEAINKEYPNNSYGTSKKSEKRQKR